MFREALRLNTCQLFRDLNRDRAVNELVLYAQHVAGSGSLQGRAVRCGTIKNYVADAASLMIHLGQLEYDPRWQPGSIQKFDPKLDAIFKEVLRFEAKANRREPFTIEMLDSMHTDAYGVFHEDSVFNSLRDWFVIGLHCGPRLSEWAQDGSVHSIAQVAIADGFGTRAFTLRNVRWQLLNGTRLHGALILPYAPTDIKACWLQWDTQKNGCNGEERLFTQPPPGSHYSMIFSMYRVVCRFVRLVGATNYTAPLGIAKDDSDFVRPITATDITTTMRTIAARVYHYDPSKKEDALALQKWSSHSLRVGACVILHSMGFTETQIQWLLRWRSLAFMSYLRNIAVLTDKHAVAFNEHSSMPTITP